MAKTTFILISVYLISLSHCSLNSEWEEWKSKYAKSYESETEEAYRRAIWEVSRKLVFSHDNRSGVSFKMELNHLADMMPYKRPSCRNTTYPMANGIQFSSYLTSAPDSFDWRTRGAVPPVHNQGQMGDALAFAAKDVIESFHFIHGGQLVDLSVQEIADCCSIHFAGPIFTCIAQHGGLCSSTSYPSGSPGTCKNSSCTPAAKISGSMTVPSGREDILQTVLLKNPVLVNIDASHPSFQLYRSGIYSESKCSKTRLDHSVVLVGYGHDGSRPFWIVKNSWGESWGMKGYVNIEKGKNMCGIATVASIPQ